MPYITADEYTSVRHLIAPEVPADEAELRSLENQIFALNRQIREFPAGNGPSPEWRALLMHHSRMMSAYRAAGGTRL